MKRRGLSTIVGATFFVIIMASTIGYVTYSLDLIDDLARQVIVKQDTKINRQNEDFKISKVSVDGANEFNITVTNTGNIPISITNMWAKNMTDSSWNQTKYKINKFISPGGSVSNIGQGTGLVAMDSESYSLKLVSSRGNTRTTQLLSASNQPLDMRLYVTPSSPVATSDVTLLYTVTNNLTEGKLLQSLTPILAPPVGSATVTYVSGPTPTSVDSLAPGEMAFFEWTYNISGGDNTQATFNATLANAVPGNNATDTLSVIVPPIAQSSINEVLGGAVGVLQMDFETFELCEPAASNCETDEPNWSRAWEGTKATKYIFRINMTNNGLTDIFLDESTAMLTLAGKSGGGGNINNAFFLKNPSTATAENGGAYTPNNGIQLIINVTTSVYYGADGAGAVILEATNTAAGIYAANILVFGHEDTNGNDVYDVGTDVPYSQNLPFQALKLN